MFEHLLGRSKIARGILLDSYGLVLRRTIGLRLRPHRCHGEQDRRAQHQHRGGGDEARRLAAPARLQLGDQRFDFSQDFPHAIFGEASRREASRVAVLENLDDTPAGIGS